MLRPRSTRLAMLHLFCLLAGAMTGCTSPPAPYVGMEPRNEVIYVIAGGWHTELAFPMSAISGLLPSLKPGFENTRYPVFGWGARDYYMARDPGLGDLLRAGVPGPAVLLVIPLQASPDAFAGAGSAFVVPVSQRGAKRLSQFLWEFWRRARKERYAPLAQGPIPEASSMPRPGLSISRIPATPGRQRLCASPACASVRRASFMRVSSSISSRGLLTLPLRGRCRRHASDLPGLSDQDFVDMDVVGRVGLEDLDRHSPWTAP
jgi:Protein of unknown function (DUF2459)